MFLARPASDPFALSSNSSLKGCDKLAQGNALGKKRIIYCTLKGCDKSWDATCRKVLSLPFRVSREWGGT